MTASTPTCPACHSKGGALTADPHCKNQDCTWNKCKCGATYDRKTQSGFTSTPTLQHFPATS